MQSEERYRELDALRGIAVLLMIFYHLAFDLAYFYDWGIPVMSGPWMTLVNATATMFFLLVGICFVISWERRCLDMRQRVIPSDPAPSRCGIVSRHGCVVH
jgi:uncharacterized membrane protein